MKIREAKSNDIKFYIKKLILKYNMPNNIIVRGKNRLDKSGLMDYLLKDIHPKKGFLTVDIRKDKKRIGFRILTSNKNSIVFASNNILSTYRVGPYRVDVSSFENIIKPLFDVDENEFLYIDEIGKMQLLSRKCKELINQYLELPNFFLATLSDDYENDFIRGIESRDDVRLLDSFDNNGYKQIKELVYRIINSR